MLLAMTMTACAWLPWSGPDSGNCLDDGSCEEPGPIEDDMADRTWYCYGTDRDQPWVCKSERDDASIRLIRDKPVTSEEVAETSPEPQVTSDGERQDRQTASTEPSEDGEPDDPVSSRPVETASTETSKDGEPDDPVSSRPVETASTEPSEDGESDDPVVSRPVETASTETSKDGEPDDPVSSRPVETASTETSKDGEPDDPVVSRPVETASTEPAKDGEPDDPVSSRPVKTASTEPAKDGEPDDPVSSRPVETASTEPSKDSDTAEEETGRAPPATTMEEGPKVSPPAKQLADGSKMLNQQLFAMESGFVVQLIALQSLEGIITFAREHGIDEPGYVYIRHQDQKWYALLLGFYADRETAQQAADAWELANQSLFEPWVRPVQSLKAAARGSLTGGNE